jgi:hypothetical protein
MNEYQNKYTHIFNLKFRKPFFKDIIIFTIMTIYIYILRIEVFVRFRSIDHRDDIIKYIRTIWIIFRKK